MLIPEIIDLLEQTLQDSSVEKNYCLGAKTTYRVGGNTEIYLSINSQQDLIKLAKLMPEINIPLLILGLGSNMLVSDSGFNGITISLGDSFNQIEILNNEVTTGGISALPVIARQSAKAGLGGFEWAVGVPGSMGGAVRMNAGAHNSDISKSLKDVEILDLTTGEVRTYTNNDLNFSYRSSVIASNQQLLVLKARFELEPIDSSKAKSNITEIVKWRRKNQPGGQNSGSVFKNPEHISAGQLLQEAGAKKLKVGSASVSSKHANFIQVKPNGKASDVFNLMKEMKEMVLKNSGIELEVETIMINFI